MPAFPSHWSNSDVHTPQAATRRRTSSGAISGIGVSKTSNSRGPRSAAIFIVYSLSSRSGQEPNSVTRDGHFPSFAGFFQGYTLAAQKICESGFSYQGGKTLRERKCYLGGPLAEVQQDKDWVLVLAVVAQVTVSDLVARSFKCYRHPLARVQAGRCSAQGDELFMIVTKS